MYIKVQRRHHILKTAKNTTEITEMIKPIWIENTISYERVRRWYARFYAKKSRVEDDQRFGTIV